MACDLTGIEIIGRLMEQVWARDVAKLEEHRAIALIPAADGSGISGVLFIDIRSGQFRFVGAKAVLLATRVLELEKSFSPLDQPRMLPVLATLVP